MALFYNVDESFSREKTKQNIKLLGGMIITIILLVLAYKVNWKFIIAAIISKKLFDRAEEKLDMLKEEQFKKLQYVYQLKDLKGFDIISNVEIVFDGVIKNVEVIAVGETGIFIIEKLNSFGTNRFFECDYKISEDINERIEFNAYNALPFELSEKGICNMNEYFNNKHGGINITLQEKNFIGEKIANFNNIKRLIFDYF